MPSGKFRILVLLLSVYGLWGCGVFYNDQRPAERSKALRHLELQAYLPPADFDVIVCIRPTDLDKDPFWRPLLEGISESIMGETSGSSTLQVSRIEEICHAQYSLGSLSLFSTKTQEGALIDEIEGRSLSRQRLKTAQDLTFRESLRFAAGEGLMVGLHTHFLALSLNDPSLARLALARAEGKMDHLPSAVGTREFLPLELNSQAAPIRIFLRGPYIDAPSPLLQNLLTAVISLQHKEATLHIDIQSLGAWTVDEQLEALFVQSVSGMMASLKVPSLSFDKLLGAPKIMCTASEPGSHCTLSFRYPAQEISSILEQLQQTDPSWLEGAQRPIK